MDGTPLYFYCPSGCQRNLIHINIIRALKMIDEEKFHCVNPVPPEEQWTERTYMLVLARLSSSGLIKDAQMKRTEECIARNLRCIN
jgi:hypothetical protein